METPKSEGCLSTIRQQMENALSAQWLPECRCFDCNLIAQSALAGEKRDHALAEAHSRMSPEIVFSRRYS
jgi:hypothetical protein